MEIHLNDRQFRLVNNAPSGTVSSATHFHYRQEGATVWAQYSGGQIVRGHMVGKQVGPASFEFRYHHLQADGTLRSGKCFTTAEVQTDGLLLLRERWQWLDGDQTTGHSLVKEQR